MKTKLLYISILAIFSIGFFVLGWYSQPFFASTVRLEITESETARLALDGQELRILTSENDYYTTRDFIFLDNKTGAVVTTLSVASLGLWTPYYKIVKGQTHDWLVVRRLETWGTGMNYQVDEWYLLGWQGNMRMVLSYSAQGFELNGIEKRYWETDIMNEGYPGDSAVDIKVIKKSCSVAEDGSDKDCSESSYIVHYVWDDDRGEFVLENRL